MTTTIKNKIVFTTKDREGKEIELAVRRPTVKEAAAGRDVSSCEFGRCAKLGMVFREQLEKELRNRNIWNDEKQAELEAIDKIIDDGVEQLKRGNITKSKGREIAVAVKLARAAKADLIQESNSYRDHTVEGHAENAQFNYLVSVCTVYNDTGKPYFKDVDDYLNRSEEPVAFEAASKFASLLYGLDSDFEAKLPENKFLSHFKFVDENGHFRDADGNRTDIFGRIIDEDGNYLDEEGNIVDFTGKSVESEEIDFSSFHDDEDSNVSVDSENATKEQPKRRGRPKSK